ncbi:MAG: YggS family pyridoxal phosphate-dependent enzyme [Bacteroidota bacterium]
MPVNLDAYRKIQAAVTAAGATLVAVSKTKPMTDIMDLYEQGHRDFGENRVAELVEKHEALPKDIRWHFIGHLQRNKVKEIVSFVHLIHAVDSPRLLLEINKRAATVDRTVDVLLQFHIAEETSKYGLLPQALDELPEAMVSPLAHVRIAGVMGMATYTDHQEQITGEFRELARAFNSLKQSHFAEEAGFREISMGMSGDYPLALAEGSTLVRVGSLLFGSRY